MTRRNDEDGRNGTKRRRRSPRIKAIPRDSRHDPEAALAKIRQILGVGGTPLTEEAARQWFARIDVENVQTERALQDKDGRWRFREPGEKHGPGRIKMRSERAVEQMESDFARVVNAVGQQSCLLGHQKAAVQRAGERRSEKGAEIAEKVCALYDASRLPIRNRTSAIASAMARDDHSISARQVRSILRKLRPVGAD